MKNQETPPEKKKKREKSVNTYLRYSGLAIQMVVTIGMAGFAGFWIDRQIGWRFPLFLLLFIILALVGIIYGIIKSSKDE
ncbi:MAG: AtpZ/AtpI family protein [Candidatus Cyclobacteriaceae bacterium M2_1C_046]